MNEKLSLQNISEVLAQTSGVPKKVADTFAKAFFDTIVESFSKGEETIKIKGFGTFKLVAVESRESVNVTNGERFVIPGYKKVAFAPEDSVVAFLNARSETTAVEEAAPTTEEGPVEEAAPATEDGPVEEVVAPTIEDSAEEVPPTIEESASEILTEDEDIDQLIQVPEPTQVERPINAFSGIDMLISTPESVEDVRQQYEEAKEKMEVAIEEARKANAEKLRLEKLLERLEQNTQPESCLAETADKESDATAPLAEEKPAEAAEGEAETPVTGTPVAEASVEPQAENPSVEPSTENADGEEEKRQAAFNRVMNEEVKDKADGDSVALQDEKDRKARRIWLIVLLSLLLAAIVFFLYRTFRNIEAVEKVPVVEKPAKPVVPAKPSTQKPQPAPSAQADTTATPNASEHQAEKKDTAKTVSGEKKEAEQVKKEPEKTTKASEASKKESEGVKKEPEKVAQKPALPKTHRVRPGESLTRISQKYYGTKDSVRAILRINAFRDPDNIPVGAVVRLP